MFCWNSGIMPAQLNS